MTELSICPSDRTMDRHTIGTGHTIDHALDTGKDIGHWGVEMTLPHYKQYKQHLSARSTGGIDQSSVKSRRKKEG